MKPDVSRMRSAQWYRAKEEERYFRSTAAIGTWKSMSLNANQFYWACRHIRFLSKDLLLCAWDKRDWFSSANDDVRGGWRKSFPCGDETPDDIFFFFFGRARKDYPHSEVLDRMKSGNTSYLGFASWFCHWISWVLQAQEFRSFSAVKRSRLPYEYMFQLIKKKVNPFTNFCQKMQKNLKSNWPFISSSCPVIDDAIRSAHFSWQSTSMEANWKENLSRSRKLGPSYLMANLWGQSFMEIALLTFSGGRHSPNT